MSLAAARSRPTTPPSGARTSVASSRSGNHRPSPSAASPPAVAEDGVGERKQPGAERPAHDLVQRVVPPDVPAEAEELAVTVEESCRVETSRHGEGRLRVAEPVGKPRDERRGHSQLALDA